jgi:hypothetical protein
MPSRYWRKQEIAVRTASEKLEAANECCEFLEQFCSNSTANVTRLLINTTYVECSAANGR